MSTGTKKLILGKNSKISLKKDTVVILDCETEAGNSLAMCILNNLSVSDLVEDRDYKYCNSLAEAIAERVADKDTPLIVKRDKGEYYGDAEEFEDAYVLSTDNEGNPLLGQCGKFTVRLYKGK